MILPDANVLIYAFRVDTQRHEAHRGWLENTLATEPTFGVSEFVLNSVVRVTTHPRIFVRPSSLKEVLEFCDFILAQRNVIRVVPGVRHWSIFSDLCRKADARGNLVAGAYLAALAIECGAEWVTTDRDFARFPGLRWRHPLE